MVFFPTSPIAWEIDYHSYAFWPCLHSCPWISDYSLCLFFYWFVFYFKKIDSYAFTMCSGFDFFLVRWVRNNFSMSAAFSFLFAYIVCCQTKAFYFNLVSVSIFSFMFYTFYLLLKNIFPSVRLQKYFPIFFFWRHYN